MSRKQDIARLYQSLDAMEVASGGKRSLAGLGASVDWPQRGVYFFFEPGEFRADDPSGLRLVRVGTHALKIGARSTLYQRLRQHAGNASNSSGNHRGSIFRLLIGDALMARGDIEKCPTWGSKLGANKVAEAPVETAVSEYMSRLLFLYLPILDTPGPESLRGFIERNAIALASGSQGPVVDPASTMWLGHNSSREKVRRSGLWNQRHTDESYDPGFLNVLDKALKRALQ